MRVKGLTEHEDKLFQRIQHMFSLKNLPTKTIIAEIFTDLRLMLTAEIDNIITSAARTVLEEIEKSVVVGSIEECWDQWSARLELSATYMLDMSASTCLGEQDNISIDDQFQIIYNNYHSHLQGEERGEEKLNLADIVQDTMIDRFKHIKL